MGSKSIHRIEENTEQIATTHKINLLVCWASSLFAGVLGFSRLSYGLLLPALQSDLGGSYAMYGALATMNFVGYLVGTLTLPLVLAHTRQRMRLNLFASCMMSFTLVASGWSFTFWQLGVWRCLNGFFAAFVTVLTLALTMECVPLQKRGKISGLIWAGGAIGIVLSGLIAPFILKAGANVGWRLVWMVMGGIGIVSALGFARARQSLPSFVAQGSQVPQSSGTQQSLRGILRPLFQPRRLLFLTLAYGGFGSGYIIYFTFLIALLQQQGSSPLNAGFVWAAIGMAGVLSGWMWGKVLDRWSTNYVLALPLLLGALGTLTVLNRQWEYVGAIVVGLSAFIAPPIMVTALLKRAVANEEYAASLSMLTAVFAVGQIVGPLIGSMIIERSSLVIGTASSGILLGFAAVCACGYGIMQKKRAH